MGQDKGSIVDARDVLDANARTRRGFRAIVRGHYRRIGPNTWDDYEYVAEGEAEVVVYPGMRIQLESSGCEFRMRSRGRVVRFAWQPDPAEMAQYGSDPAQLRARFVDHFVEDHDEKPGYGAAAVIASKLRG